MRISDWSSDVCSSDLFEDGMVFDHEWTRTISETDNRWFSLLTMNTQPVHIDVHAAAKSVWGRPLVNSLFTLGCMVGMMVNDTTFGTTVANLGMTDVRFPHPLFEGDTIRMRSEEHTSELQSLMRISYSVFCLKTKQKTTHNPHTT